VYSSDDLGGAHNDVQAHRLFFALQLFVTSQEGAKPIHGIRDGFLVRQKDNSEMVRLFPVKSRTLN
jgi:hypothetical protein